MVKGKTESTRIFELIGTRDNTDKADLKLAERFSSAPAAYRARDWDRSEKTLRECLALRTDDAPSRLFLERIAVFRSKPPAPDWDGAWVLDEK